MPQTPHIERHFTSSEAVRDIVIGMADIKGRFTVAVPIRSASQTLVTCALAAAGAYVLRRVIF